MLLDDIKKANIEAMKAHDANKRAVLGIVITKCQLQSVEFKAQNKEFTDSNVLEVIQKTLKELSDEKEGYLKAGNSERANLVAEQAKTIEIYLPKQLSKEEIVEEINKLSDKSMPAVMKYFKENFAGKVDMSLVSQVARGL